MSDETHKSTDLIEQTEQIFFTLQPNLTQEAKNIIWQFLSLARANYHSSKHKEEWDVLLKNLQQVIFDFENEYSATSEIKLHGLKKNIFEGPLKPDKGFDEDISE